MVTLATGSGIARVISVLSIPLLTRLYTPEDFGVLAIFTALVMTATPFVTLRYVVAIPLPRTNAMALNVMALASVTTCVMLLLIALIIGALSSNHLRFESVEMLGPWRWLLIPALGGTACYEILSMWATRQRAYTVMATTQLSQSISGTLLKLALGLISFRPAGLLIGQIANQCGGISTFAYRFRNDFRHLRRRVDVNRILFLARYYADIPLFRLPSQAILAIGMQAPVFFVAALYDAKTTGHYGLAITATSLPIALLGHSVGKAMYAEASSIGARHPDKIYNLVVSSQKHLFVIATPIATAIFFGAELLFPRFLGSSWLKAGQFAALLSISMLFQFTCSPLMQVLNLFNMHRAFLLLNIVRVALLCSVFAIAYYADFQSLTFVASLSCTLAVYYAGLSVWIVLAVKSKSFMAA